VIGNPAGPLLRGKIFERNTVSLFEHPSLPPATAPLVDPVELPTWVRWQDERLLVMDKPGWLVVHPSKNGPWSSLAGALREGMGLETVRFIYRLDRETSGVVILAKDEATGSRLQKAMGQRLIGKAYVALLQGELRERVAVDRPLGPDLTANVTVKQRVVESGAPDAQEAGTLFHPLVTRGGYTLVGIELKTGRKHQIRAHAEWLGHRVVGDKLYGPDPTLYLEFAERGWTARHSALLATTRQALHCAAIDLRPARLDHVFTAPWPEDLSWFAERAMSLPRSDAQAAVDTFVSRLFAANRLPPLPEPTLSQASRRLSSAARRAAAKAAMRAASGNEVGDSKV
jgi:23S rRNA pseudouridine1911/1915/1917 synthase